MSDDGVEVDCQLGDMRLSVSADDLENAVEVFEEVWAARLREVQNGENSAFQELEQQQEDSW